MNKGGINVLLVLANSMMDNFIPLGTSLLSACLKKGQVIIKNELRNLIDLNTLPFQDWTIYEEKRFYKPMGGKIYVMGNVEVNRSCMHKSTYCANAALLANMGSIDYRDIKNFLKALKESMQEMNLNLNYTR